MVLLGVGVPLWAGALGRARVLRPTSSGPGRTDRPCRRVSARCLAAGSGPEGALGCARDRRRRDPAARVHPPARRAGARRGRSRTTRPTPLDVCRRRRGWRPHRRRRGRGADPARPRRDARRGRATTSSARPSNGEQAVELAAELRPDLVIMDVKMPVLDGISAAEQIARGNASPRSSCSPRSRQTRARRAGPRRRRHGLPRQAVHGRPTCARPSTSRSRAGTSSRRSRPRSPTSASGSRPARLSTGPRACS